MARPSPAVEAMVRHAFSLVLELRSHREAQSILAQAIAFLRLLAEERGNTRSPLVISVRAVHIRGN
jgi:hypothetical protein